MLKFIIGSDFMRTVLAFLCMAGCCFGSDLVFDGVSTGGWTISNQPLDPPVPFTDVEGTGFPGIAFNDVIQGVGYYVAPQSVIDNLDDSLSFQFWIDADGTTLVDDDTFADFIVNGTPLTLDLIDEDNLDSLQRISLFLTPYGQIDSLWIRSEFWSAGGERIESYLVSTIVPEPWTFGIMFLCLIGVVIYVRTRM